MDSRLVDALLTVGTPHLPARLRNGHGVVGLTRAVRRDAMVVDAFHSVVSFVSQRMFTERKPTAMDSLSRPRGPRGVVARGVSWCAMMLE
ncbi:hypothetical protein GS491_06820 [Rhodococcus hoagii]|nr:hypothetical protein [Prescottella equi]